MSAPDPRQCGLFASLDGRRRRGPWAGEGPGTAEKERGFAAIMATAMQIHALALRNQGRVWPYYHLDVHSGPGWNARANCEGSPINFLRHAKTYQLPDVRSLCVDQDAAAIAALRERVARLGLPPAIRVDVDVMDNRLALARFRRMIVDPRPVHARGLIVIDPNGAIEDAPPSARRDAGSVPYRELVQFCAECQSIDVLCNFAHDAKVRWQGRQRRGYADGLARYLPEIDEFAVDLSRSYGLIQERHCGAGRKFVTVVLTNYPGARAHPSLGIYPLESPQGRAIAARLLLQAPKKEVPCD
jgi:hypothetical protein